MSRRADAHRALQSALMAQLQPLSPALMADRSIPWASATFSGMRHEWDVHLAGPRVPDDAEHYAQRAASHDYAIPGHLVADFTTQLHPCADGTRLHVEALTVEA